MTFRLSLLGAGSLAALLGFSTPVEAQDAEAALRRNFGKSATLRYRLTSAEYFKVDGDPTKDLEVHGNHEFTVSLAEAPNLAQTWLTSTDWRNFHWSHKSAATSDEWNSGAVVTMPPETERGRIAPDGVSAGGYVFNEKTKPAGLRGSETAADHSYVGLMAESFTWLYRPSRQFDLLFPVLTKDAFAKGGRWDGDILAGALGEHDVRFFFANVCKRFDDKKIEVVSSGKPQFVKSGRKPGDLVFALDESKSHWSHEIVFDRATGAVARREGEFVLSVAMNSMTAKEKVSQVTAKVWMKLERLDQ